MKKIYYVAQKIIIFFCGLIIFDTIFIVTEFLFFRFFGYYISILEIYLKNYKILLLCYTWIYIIVNIAIYVYDKYYIIKINDLLTKIKWGENNEKK